MFINLHNGRLGQAVNLRIERADTIWQTLWKHWNHSVCHIDRRRAVKSFLVKGRTLGHIVGNIRDVNSEFDIAIFQSLDMHRVVQVLGIRTVNGKCKLISQIKTPFHILFCGSIRHTFCFFKDSLWKLGYDIHRLQNLKNINTWICRMPYHVQYTSDKEIMFLTWVFVDKDLENLCPFQLDSWFLNIDGLADFLIFWTDVASILGLFLIQNDLTDNGCQTML